jgi:putative SOS response-associated peptidase YedK
MCGRYKRRSDKNRLVKEFNVTGNVDDVILPADDDVRPTTMQPIIRANKETGERDLVVARSEGIEKAGMWKRAFEHHRCLVPADSFYEWHKIRKKDNPKYEIALEGEKTFAFAGLWGAWKNPDTGDWLQSYTILTTDPNELMETIHTRMPVILHPKDYARWLSREDDGKPPLDLLRPFEAEKMNAHLTGNKQDEMFVEPNST